MVSKAKGNCYNNNSLFYCDIKDIIYNFDNDKNGYYSIIYKGKCEQNLTIEGKVVTIKRGIGLSDITPNWINKNIENKGEIIIYIFVLLKK